MKNIRKTSKVYQKSDGKFKEEFFMEAVNFFDKEKGEYREIDNTLEECQGTVDLPVYYQNKANDFNVKLLKAKQSDKHIVIEKDGCRITFVFVGNNRMALNSGDAVLQSSENQNDAFGRKMAINQMLVYEDILPETDLKFSIKGDRVKDYIVIKGKKEVYEYAYRMKLENLRMQLSERSDAVEFISMTDGERVFSMPAPMMEDAEGRFNSDVYFEIDTVSENEYTLQVKADENWINDENTVLPVSIDPEIVVASESSMLSRYGWYNRTLSTLNSGLSYLGYYAGGASGSSSTTEWKPYERQYYKFALNAFRKNSVIKKVELVVDLAGNTKSTAYYIAAGKTSLGLTHTGSYICDPDDPQIADYVEVGKTRAYYRLDITSIVREAISENEAYAKFYLKGLYEKMDNPDLRLYSSTVEVTYEQGCKSETIGTTEQQDVGRAGVGTVNLYTGALKFTHQDVSWNGNLMPVSIEHIFDSMRSNAHYTGNGTEVITANYGNMLIGHGWKLNLQQSVVSFTPSDFGLSEDYKYVYSDENGLAHFLKLKDPTDSQTLYVDDNDEMLEYDSKNRILNKDGLQYTFNEDGYLVKITNEYNVMQEIVYDSAHRIVSVKDGAKRGFGFTYTSNRLSGITLPSNQTITYTYTNEKLMKITYPDGHSVRFKYDSDNLTKVVNCNVSADGYSVAYTYANAYPMVKTITHNGIETEIKYGSKLMTVVSKNDEEYITNEAYEFDSEGNFKGSYTLDQASSELVLNTENLLINRSFSNDFKYWTRTGEWIYTGTSYKLYGKTLSICGCGCTECNSILQTRTLPMGTYTFSAYVRRSRDSYDAACCAKAYIEIESGGKIDRSKTVVDTNGEYQRLYCTITTSATQNVTVRLVNSGKQYAHFSGLQLQRGEAVTAYNYLGNSNFERGKEFWTVPSDYEISYGERQDGSYSLKLNGMLGESRSAGQTIDLYTPKSTRETFEFSGWAKAYYPVDREEESDETAEFEAKFALRAQIYYTDDTYDEFDVDFAKNNVDWQYVSLSFAKKQYKNMDRLVLSCVFDNSIGEAYFDGLQLICTNIEKSLGASDYAEEEEEESTTEDVVTIPGELSEEDAAATEEETEEKDESLDAFGNTLYSINDVEGKKGSMYQTYGYSDDGNEKLYETDNRNNRTVYTYDERTSLVKTMTAPCRSQVSYTYDEMNQLKSMEASVDGVSAAVNYTYDYLGNISTITQNGFTYAIAYTIYNEIASIGVSGQTPLVSYTYTGGGNVKTATYANGNTMTCSYDRFGNMLSEKWTNGNATTEYAYSYDGNGNVVKTLDKANNLMYTYKYNDGQLIQTEEYSVTLSNDQVTEKTLLHRTELHYKDGKIGQKVEVYATNGEETSQAYDYTYLTNEEDKFTLILPTGVKSVAGTDHFGRKTFDEVQLGTGFVGREYTYVKGEYDAEKLAGKLKSTPETDLMEKIVFNDGKELRYTYNEAGDITQVRDESGVLLEAYTYDGLGRLKTEQNVAGKFYKVYTYDVGGNIKIKETYTCTTTTVVTSASGLSLSKKDTYTYDSVWKDKLTAYNSDIEYNSDTYTYKYTYDAGGNPTARNDVTATWEKGRQLKTLGANVYTYNASGVRISKKANGVLHKYTVEGINILREEFEGHVLDFLYGVDGSAVGFTDNGTAYYYRKNLQGDVIGILDANGAEIATYTYDAWGKVLSVGGNTTIGNLNPIRYRGYYYDTETELYYLNSRYYDPEVCRFINADEPKALCEFKELHYNQIYCYCENNPLISKDLDGRISLFSLIKFFKKCGSFVYQLFKVVVNFGIKMLKALWSVFVQPGKINIKPLDEPRKGLN